MDANNIQEINQKKLNLQQKYQKDNTLYMILLLIEFSLAATFWLISPFFPPMALSKGISETYIGVILSVEPCGSFITALIVGKLLHKFGKKNLTLFSLTIAMIGCFCFGNLVRIQNRYDFFIVSISTRIIQGIGNAIGNTCQFALITQIFNDHPSLQLRIALAAAAQGVAGAVSPFIGGILYEIGGYSLPFFSVSGMLLLIIIIVIKKYPQDAVNQAKQSISILKYMTNIYIFAQFLIIFFLSSSLSFIQPVIANHLRNKFQFSPVKIGLMFTFVTVSYMVGIPFFEITPKDSDRKLFIMIGSFLCSISYFLLGPEKLIFPLKLYIILIGGFLLGFGVCFAEIPSIPSFINIGNEQFKDLYTSQQISDMSSGIFNASWILGGFLGPLSSGILVDHFGFPTSASCFGILQLLNWVFYVIIMRGDKIIYKTFCRGQITQQANINDNLDYQQLNEEINSLNEFSNKQQIK